MSIDILLCSKNFDSFLIYLVQYHIKNYFYVKTRGNCKTKNGTNEYA